MSYATSILYDLIEKRLDQMGSSYPFLESDGSLTILRQSISELKSMHVLELEAARFTSIDGTESKIKVLRGKK